MCELTKKCRACLEEKELKKFWKKNTSKDGYHPRCIKCVKDKKLVVKKERVIIYELTGEILKCKACKKEKDKCFYYFNKRDNKYYSKCNECYRNQVLIEKETLTERICKDCNTLQNIDSFYKSHNGTIPFTSCKLCHLKKNRSYSKDYYKNNKDKVKTTKNKRKLDNPLISISEQIDSNIKRTIKNTRNKSKTTKAVEILGCKPLEFKIHIESQFLNWMTWENYGNCETLQYDCSWDFDHIIPISYAKTEEEIYLLNHWSNFQPLCSKINRNDKKGKVPLVTNLELNITTIKNNYK